MLAKRSVVLDNFPRISDATNFLQIYRQLGLRVDLEAGSVRIQMNSPGCAVPGASLVHARYFRSSILLLGSALLRLRSIGFPWPGGDDIGPRDFRMFFRLLDDFGIANWTDSHGIHAEIGHCLEGDRHLDLRTNPPSPVAGNNVTALALILAAGNRGITNITHALDVGETRLLGTFLRTLGVEIDGLGTRTLTVASPGMKGLAEDDVELRIPGDKIEIGFWILAAMLSRGCIDIADGGHPAASIGIFGGAEAAYLNTLNTLGISLQKLDDGTLRADYSKSALRPGKVEALYEGAEAEIVDAMPQFVPLLGVIPGTSTWQDTHLGNSRIRFARQLEAMGARINYSAKHLEIRGTPNYVAAEISGQDSRGAASLLLAAVAAKGTSTLHGIEHIERVYDDLPGKLRTLDCRLTTLST